MSLDNNTFMTSIDVKNAKGNVIIVGNAYGIMPYIRPLATKLAHNGFKPFWFAFRGQEKRQGVYSFDQGIKDIGEIYNIVSKDNDLPIHFLTHCAGSLITLEFLKKNPDIIINKLIIYGLLYSMNRRRPIAERKLNGAGINYVLSEKDWLYNPTETIRGINNGILFCHAKDKLNLERATEQEMDSIDSLRSNIILKWFNEGYDKNSENVSLFIDTYVSYFNGYDI